MVLYAPPAYRPAVSSPTSRRQATYVLGQTFDQMFNWHPAAGDVLRLSFHGAAAYLGYHVWVNDKGFIKWFGLAFGIGQSVGAICDVVSLVQRILGTHPPEH